MKKINLNQLSMSWRGKRKTQNSQEKQKRQESRNSQDRRGKLEAEETARMDGAYIQHIFSIYSAYIGTCWRPAGKKATTPFRAMRYAAVLLMLLTLGVGQMGAWDYTIYCLPEYLWGDDWSDSGTDWVRVQYSKNNSDAEGYVTMSKTELRYSGYDIYKATIGCKYEGADWINFQRMTGGSETVEHTYACIKNWWGEDGFNGKLYKGDWSSDSPVWHSLSYDTYDITATADVYFDNTETNWSNVSIHFVQSGGTYDYAFTQISGTPYWKYSFTSNWSDYGTAIFFQSGWGHQSGRIYSDIGSGTTLFTPNSGSDYAGFSTTAPVGPKNIGISNTGTVYSGDGKSGTPYIVKAGTAITCEASAEKIDASTTLEYKFNAGTTAYSTTATNTIVASAVANTDYTAQATISTTKSSNRSRAFPTSTIYYTAKNLYIGLSASKSPSAGSASAPTIGANWVEQTNGVSVTAGTEATGYDFTGWTSNNGTFANAANKTTTFTPSADNAVAVANYAKHDYTISYSPSPAVNFTYTTAPSTAQYGDQVDFTFTPSTNYIISSVEAEDEDENTVTVTHVDGNDYRIASMPAKDITITVTVALSSVAVNYGSDSNGSLAAEQDDVSIGDSGSEVDGGSTVDFTATPNTGYEVEGWYESYSEGVFSDKIDAAGTDDTYSVVAYSTLNVYVKFKLIDYTITYLDKGGSAYSGSNSGSLPATYNYGEGATLVDGVKTGYDFGGWYTSSDCSTGSTTSIGASETGNKTFYAKWTAHTYSVVFNANGGSGSMSDEEFTYGTAKTLTSNSFTRAGYTFNGWNTVSGGGGTSYTDGQSVSNLTATDEGIVTLYAQWAARPYVKVYFAKPADWEHVYAYAWKDGGTGNDEWPGKQLDGSVSGTGTEVINCATYYYYRYYTDAGSEDAEGEVGSSTWDEIIFNDGTGSVVNDTKTSDLIITSGNCYGIHTGMQSTSTSGYSTSDKWTIRGSFNSWSDNLTFDCASETHSGSVLVEGLTASTTYEFKIWGPDGVAYKFTGGKGSSYDAEYSITSLLDGTEMDFKEYATGNNSFVTATTSYRFTLDVTDPKYPKLTVLPGDDEDYTATFAVSGHGSISTPGTGSKTIHKYAPTKITAVPEVGYRFNNWTVSGEDASHVSIVSTTSATTTVTADATLTDATITANFTQDGIIYFDNTMSQWQGDIYVYLFTNSSTNPWWNTMDGSSNGPGIVLKKTDGTVLYNYYGKMTRIAETNIYYFDYKAAGCSSTIYKVVFTKGDYHTSAGLYQTSAAYLEEFPTCYPMYLASKNWTTTNSTGYHSAGYWKRYNVTNSGYTLYGTWDNDLDGETWDENDAVEFTSVSPNSNTFKAKVHLNNETHQFKIWRCSGEPLGNSGTMTPTNHSGLEMTPGSSNCKIEAPAGGDYEFTINLGTDHIYLSVEYPLLEHDYHLIHTGRITADGSDSHVHDSKPIRHLRTASSTQRDTVSFYIVEGNEGTIKLQRCTNPASNSGKGAWTDTLSALDLSDIITETGIYNFEIVQTTDASGVRTASASILDSDHRKYNGKLYIRTDVADGGWEAYKEVENNQMEYSDYSKAHSGYDYYHCHWTPTDKNLHFTIANDYSPSISDTMKIGPESPFDFENLPYQASVRFMYNSETNELSRAYLNGSSEGGDARYLILRCYGDSIRSTGDKEIVNITESMRDTIFKDFGNWIYQLDVEVLEGTHIRLISNYFFSGATHYQYFKGNDAVTWTPASTEQILGGKGDTWQTLRLVYDYKTNHLVSAWLAPTSGETGNLALYADAMIVREQQGDARQITFAGSNKLTEVDTVYAVMQFNKWTMNNKSIEEGHADLTGDDILSEAERNIYWISFPFDVKLNDVFGFGTYGTHWGIEYYDGKERAQKGYWKDSPGFWKLVSPEERTTFELKANVGYLLVLDLDLMTLSSKVWEYVEDVSLYFPSKNKVGTIQTTDKTVPINQEDYQCTIDRTGLGGAGADINKNRYVADSYWHCIGVPSYANKTRADMPVAEPSDPDWTSSVPYLYVWNGKTGAYTVNSVASVDFKATYAYMVQYSGATIDWTSVSASPAAVRAQTRTQTDYTLRMELSKNDVKEDQTYICLSASDDITTGFEFNHDLFKEMNGGSGNIYTLISGYIPAAANCLPMSEQTTVVPVGVQIAANGEYTFAMPEGTNGVGVVLVDNVANTRTNLALGDYTVNLNAGQIDGRFVLEISAVNNSTTDVEGVSETVNGASKRIVDGKLYIIKDEKVFDATGARVK